MWGQGQLKGKTRLWQIPVKKGEIFKVVIFAIKSIHSMHNLTESSMVQYFHLSVLHALVAKRIWKLCLWTFSKLWDDMKAIVDLIDLNFRKKKSKLWNFEIIALYNSFCVFWSFIIKNCLIIEWDVAVWILASFCAKIACSDVIKLAFSQNFPTDFAKVFTACVKLMQKNVL